ncbi:hypothetical protein D3C77_575300 [compost metagenome]
MDEIGQMMGNEHFHFLHVLFQRFLDGSRRRTVQPAKRKLADMASKLDPETIKNTKSGDMRNHSSRIHRCEACRQAD